MQTVSSHPEPSELGKVRLALDSLSIYRSILEDKVVTSLYDLLQYCENGAVDLNRFVKLYNEFYFKLISVSPITSLKNYLIEKLLFDENPFTLSAEADGSIDPLGSLGQSAINDLRKLQQFSGITSTIIKEWALRSITLSKYESDLLNHLPDWNNIPYGQQVQYYQYAQPISDLLHSKPDWSSCFDSLIQFHHSHGCGIFARYKAFIWECSDNEGYLRGISDPDKVTLSDLIGYESERSEILDNTLQFIKGFSANNVLLYGDRGTGKSSTVKAILNKYHNEGIRLIEVPKNHLMDFPRIIRYIKDRKQKFIIFVDDLAFEDNEENYTALKAVLEGGIETKPGNVVIYATSNRRHLVKEKFSDRAGLISGSSEDEIRAADTIQEKLSLSDRFGMTIIFSSPDKERYLEIVDGIVRKRGLEIERELLHKEALKWELWYNGRSPRTARQFVDWLEGKLNME